ncbi:MAG: HAMP domain-containing histidine kinase [Prolixibacteraceae bacterium]|nr:HAMP domain-containing histidine kinase [Prolixibacteraceae bacterium]
MRRFFIIVSVLLLVVCVLPVSYFVLRHFSSLTENEEMVQEVFEGQIETILFSLNQQTENIVSLWMNKLDVPVNYLSGAMSGVADKLLGNNPAIISVCFFNKIGDVSAFYGREGAVAETVPFDKMLFDKLIDYKTNNYQRIEPVRDDSLTHLFFAPFNVSNDILAVVTVYTPAFIRQNLSAGIQQVAGQSFNISVVDTITRAQIYSVGFQGEEQAGSYRKSSWYLPGYIFSTSLRSATIDELVYERSKRDNYIFLGLFVFVVIGLVVVIGSIRKEIMLTEMKSDFVSNVSHEIRTPLALISMYSETLLLKRVKSKEKEEEYLRIINLESNRLNALVNQILNFSRMERNKRKYCFEEININELISDINQSFKPHYDQHEVKVKLELLNKPTYCMADRQALSECLTNLIDNAIKYGKEDGKEIVIRSHDAGSQIFVEVEDNGIGIPQKYQKHIFEKFYRVTHRNLAHVAKGSGLGLNIVFRIMKVHGGKVSVESKEGKGSCFKLHIPVKQKNNGQNTSN